MTRTPSKPLVLVALLMASFVINLDTTLVNVALPTLTRELGATTAQLQWVVDAYNLVFAALLLTSGSLSDRFGRKGMLMAGLLVFGACQLRRRVRHVPGRADRGPRRHGPRGRDDVPGHAVAAHRRLHQPQGARVVHRPVGSDGRDGHRPGADRGRLPARALQLVERLLHPRAGVTGRHRPGGAVRAPARRARRRTAWTSWAWSCPAASWGCSSTPSSRLPAAAGHRRRRWSASPAPLSC